MPRVGVVSACVWARPGGDQAIIQVGLHATMASFVTATIREAIGARGNPWHLREAAKASKPGIRLLGGSAHLSAGGARDAVLRRQDRCARGRWLYIQSAGAGRWRAGAARAGRATRAHLPLVVAPRGGSPREGGGGGGGAGGLGGARGGARLLLLLWVHRRWVHRWVHRRGLCGVLAHGAQALRGAARVAGLGSLATLALCLGRACHKF